MTKTNHLRLIKWKTFIIIWNHSQKYEITILIKTSNYWHAILVWKLRLFYKIKAQRKHKSHLSERHIEKKPERVSRFWILLDNVAKEGYYFAACSIDMCFWRAVFWVQLKGQIYSMTGFSRFLVSKLYNFFCPWITDFRNKL